MLRINEISVSLGADREQIIRAAASAVVIDTGDITYFEIARESIDSRKKNNIKMIYSVNIEIDGDEQSVAARFPANKISLCERYHYEMPTCRRTSRFRPIIVGFGPAGMFSALVLARAGLRPLVLRRLDGQ